jgi:hypothetical protein
MNHRPSPLSNLSPTPQPVAWLCFTAMEHRLQIVEHLEYIDA